MRRAKISVSVIFGEMFYWVANKEVHHEQLYDCGIDQCSGRKLGHSYSRISCTGGCTFACFLRPACHCVLEDVHKGGEKGWKSIIPIYNMYIAFKIAWKDGKAFWIYLIATFATGIVSSFVVNADGSSNIIAALLATVVSIVALVWAIRFSIKQAHAYSKGTGCGILAIFFPNIMTLYYAFASSAVYAGPQD